MKQAWYSRKWVVVLLHVAAWSLLLSLPYLLNSTGGEKRPQPNRAQESWHGIVFSIVMDGTWITFFYINALVLIPKFIYNKKYWQFATIQCIILACLLFEVSVLIRLIFDTNHFDSRAVLFNLFIYLFIFGLSSAYRLISDKVKTDRLASERENENLKTELSFLRSQVSPHFMFNVLNNMVALARKQSAELEPSLIKLSSLMRYMLYEADEEEVPLEKEVEYLQSYIDLQQQRFGKNLKISFSPEVPDKGYMLEPMILIPFVENAFKHGTGMIEQAEIIIELKAKNNILQFSVRNRFNAVVNEVKDKTSGIGLTNVKRRLNLLYAGNHSLLVTNKNNWFVVSLQLNLH